jgi:hypothetical protein
LRSRSKKVRRNVRTLHLRIFTNRNEEEDRGQTDDRQTACGLPDTPHHLAEEKVTPDCHVNIFSLDEDNVSRVYQSKNYDICKTCKKRMRFMASLGSLA